MTEEWPDDMESHGSLRARYKADVLACVPVLPEKPMGASEIWKRLGYNAETTCRQALIELSGEEKVERVRAAFEKGHYGQYHWLYWRDRDGGWVK